MKFSYNWLKEYLDKIPEPKKLAEILTMRIFEVEEVKKAGDDTMLDIKILPNRAADCFSHLGIAREIAAIAGAKFKEPAAELKESGEKTGDYVSVEVKEKKFCPRYSARVVRGVKVEESPDWLKKRLETCGLRPINNIVDITNFVMLETGQPLHAFDFDKIECENPKFQKPISKQISNPKTQIKKIIIRKAKVGEKIITLDEGRAERELDENILVIADKEKPIAIAGIKGGRGTEIAAETKNIIIEGANFEAVNIRKSSKALNLRTDASVRFENRPDINLTLPALARCAALIKEIAGGEVAAGAIDEAALSVKPWSVGMAHQHIESLLGTKIKSEQVKDIFDRLVLPSEVIKKDNQIFYEVMVPTRRPDLQTAEDLIEEIGRFCGYENIKSVMPGGIIIPALKDEQLVYADGIKDLMRGFGFSEVYNYSFIGEEDVEFYGLAGLAQLRNPFSREQKYLRPNLAVGFIKNIAQNAAYLSGSRFVDSLRLFEIGQVFCLDKNKIYETRKIGGLVFIKKEKGEDTFYELKGAVGELFNKLGLADVWDDENIEAGLWPGWQNILQAGGTALIKIGEQTVGWLGKVGEEIIVQAGVKGQAAIFEIDFASIVHLIDEERKYEPPSKFPSITRDLSVLVEPGEKVERVLSLIESAGGEMLDNISLFDLYEEPSSELKSLSFHLIFQSYEKNLTDGEVNKLMEKIIQVLEGEGWEVKK